VLAVAEDLLDEDRRLPRHAGKRGGGQPLEVAARVEQSVGVVDPEAVHPASGTPVENQRVGLGEDLGILHVQRHEVVHVEEPAVVDLARRPPPMHQPVDLRIEQPGEPRGSIRPRPKGLDGGLDLTPDGRVFGRQPQPIERLRDAAAALLDRAGETSSTPGQSPQPADRLSHGGAAGVLGAEPVAAARQRGTQHQGQRRRVQREGVLEVADARHAALRHEGELAPLERMRPRLPQHRQEHPAPQVRLRGAPFDIEPAGIAGRRAVGEDVLPGGILVRGRHVVGHDVEHEPHPLLRQRLVQRGQVGLGAELGVEHGGIDHVVAVGAALPGAEQRRAVEMADAQAPQVGNERARGGEGEAAVKLEPVGGQDLRHRLTAAPRVAAASGNARPG
jgi:hypothetical protein